MALIDVKAEFGGVLIIKLGGAFSAINTKNLSAFFQHFFKRCNGHGFAKEIALKLRAAAF
jgi:hypothetical protein